MRMNTHTIGKFIALSIAAHLAAGAALIPVIRFSANTEAGRDNVITVSLISGIEPRPSASVLPRPVIPRKPRPVSVPELDAAPNPSVETIEPARIESRSDPISSGGEEEPLSIDMDMTAEMTTSSAETAGFDASLPAEGSSPAGNGASVEDLLTPFLADLRNRLDQAKRYPRLARLRGQEGTVRLQFRIDPDGQPLEIRLLESSRWPMLDEEAVETVKRVGRFPDPPVAGNLNVVVPIVFHLE